MPTTGIHIKHPGLLHKKLGVKKGDHIATTTLESKLAAAKRSGNVKLEKELVFAINSRSWKH